MHVRLYVRRYVCLYVRVCKIQIRAHVLIHRYKNLHITCTGTFTHARTYRPTCLPTYVHTYLSTYVPAYLPTFVHTYLRTFIHTCLSVIYRHIQVLGIVFTYTYIYMYITDFVLCYFTNHTNLGPQAVIFWSVFRRNVGPQGLFFVCVCIYIYRFRLQYICICRYGRGFWVVGLLKPCPQLQRLCSFGLVLFNSLPKSSHAQKRENNYVVGM